MFNRSTFNQSTYNAVPSFSVGVKQAVKKILLRPRKHLVELMYKIICAKKIIRVKVFSIVAIKKFIRLLTFELICKLKNIKNLSYTLLLQVKNTLKNKFMITSKLLNKASHIFRCIVSKKSHSTESYQIKSSVLRKIEHDVVVESLKTLVHDKKYNISCDKINNICYENKIYCKKSNDIFTKIKVTGKRDSRKILLALFNND